MGTTESTPARGTSARFAKHRLKSDRIELTLLPEFGCHWWSLRLSVKGEWRDLLVPVPDEETLLARSTSFGSYTLAPWSNRIAGAVFDFEGNRYTLRPNFRDGTAIHGDVRTRPWEVRAATEEKLEATLDARRLADFNFPFALVYHHAIACAGDRLRVSVSMENADSRRAPVGLGFHPFFQRRLTEKDRDVMVLLPAEKVYPAVGCIPTGPAVAVAGSTDLRELKPLGSPNLDHCFTGLSEGLIRLIYAGTGLEVRLELDPVFGHAVVYAPNQPDGTPKDFVAVEPVTNVNDGFNLHERGWSGTGVKVLEPGERFTGTWELSVGDL
jgi:aldose 1-epimerase